MQSWFEDDATVRALVEGRPRPERDVSVRRMLEEVLPTRRDIWTERLLLLVLWLQAAPTRELFPEEPRDESRDERTPMSYEATGVR